MKLRIEQDTDAMSPSDLEGDGLFLIGSHREFYVLPPGMKRNERFDVKDEIDARKSTHHIFMLEAYIHSGVVLALAGEGNFPDRQWDVSLLGAVFASKKEWYTKAKARKAVESKVKEWNEYLSGDVWGCIVEDDEGNHVDSCWGFYGHEYAKQEGQRMLKYAEENAFTPAV
jgi:hypothetical protein